MFFNDVFNLTTVVGKKVSEFCIDAAMYVAVDSLARGRIHHPYIAVGKHISWFLGVFCDQRRNSMCLHCNP